MAEVKISKRYAKGLFDFAKNANKLEEAYTEIKQISEVLKENRQLRVILSSPVLDYKKKVSILKEVFKEISLSTLNFLNLIARQGRASLIGDIAQQFVVQYNQEIGKSIATITLAQDLPESLINQIVVTGRKEVAFEGKEIELVKKIDPSIIGGFVCLLFVKQIRQ